jgi:hypothetical protein
MAKELASSKKKKGFINPFGYLSQHRGFFSIVFVSLAVILILISYSAVQQQTSTKSRASTDLSQCENVNCASLSSVYEASCLNNDCCKLSGEKITKSQCARSGTRNLRCGDIDDRGLYMCVKSYFSSTCKVKDGQCVAISTEPKCMPVSGIGLLCHDLKDGACTSNYFSKRCTLAGGDCKARLNDEIGACPGDCRNYTSKASCEDRTQPGNAGPGACCQWGEVENENEPLACPGTCNNFQTKESCESEDSGSSLCCAWSTQNNVYACENKIETLYSNQECKPSSYSKKCSSGLNCLYTTNGYKCLSRAPSAQRPTEGQRCVLGTTRLDCADGLECKQEDAGVWICRSVNPAPPPAPIPASCMQGLGDTCGRTDIKAQACGPYLSCESSNVCDFSNGASGKCVESRVKNESPCKDIAGGNCVDTNKPNACPNGLNILNGYCPTQPANIKCCAPSGGGGNPPGGGGNPPSGGGQGGTPTTNCSTNTSKNTCEAVNKCYWVKSNNKCIEKCGRATTETLCDSQYCVWDSELKGNKCRFKCPNIYDKAFCNGQSGRCEWKENTSTCINKATTNCSNNTSKNTCEADNKCYWYKSGNTGVCETKCGKAVTENNCNKTYCVWNNDWDPNKCRRKCEYVYNRQECTGRCEWKNNTNTCINKETTPSPSNNCEDAKNKSTCDSIGRCKWVGDKCKRACSQFENLNQCSQRTDCIWEFLPD